MTTAVQHAHNRIDDLEKKVVSLQAELASLWQQTGKARLNTMVFGPGDNDYGRREEAMKAFEEACKNYVPKADRLPDGTKE